ncbi:hypothetical protein ACJJTC_000135, partial [Scirpophaga incertulas]
PQRAGPWSRRGGPDEFYPASRSLVGGFGNHRNRSQPGWLRGGRWGLISCENRSPVRPPVVKISADEICQYGGQLSKSVFRVAYLSPRRPQRARVCATVLSVSSSFGLLWFRTSFHWAQGGPEIL